MEPREREERFHSRRAALIELALDLDKLIDRAEQNGQRLVAYLLRVARDALSDSLGERTRRH